MVKLDTERKFQNLAKRLLALPSGTHHVVVAYLDGVTYGVKQGEGGTDLQPAKLRATAIEDILSELSYGIWRLDVTCSRYLMDIRAQRMARAEK